MTQKVEYGSEGSPLQRVEYGPDDCMVIHGSSLMGTYLTRYDTLVDHFGEPNCPPGDKTWNNWDLCFRVYDEDGEDSEDVYVSIYDWKESNPDHSRIGEYRWHIGGHRNTEHRADWLVSDLLYNSKDEPVLYNFVRADK